MFKTENRLSSKTEIAATLARGRKLRLPSATVSLWITGGQEPPRFALAVGKSVGNSVVRSRVSRRIRHGLLPLVPSIPRGSRVVVRAYAGCQLLSSGDWQRHIAEALHKAGVVDNTVDVLITDAGAGGGVDERPDS